MLVLPACVSTPLQDLLILGTSLSYAAARDPSDVTLP